MKKRLVVSTLLGCALLSSPALAGAPAQPVWKPAGDPKPLSEGVVKGLGWLIAHQHENGGWSQGEESANMGPAGKDFRDLPNVGDSCAALLALMRSGSTASAGEYAEPIRKGLGFVCAEIERSDADSLNVTEIRGTRLQAKLGAYIDTFLASLVLAEAVRTLPTPEEEQRVAAAQTKVLRKIEKNQREDGSFGGAGWANTLSQGLAAKSVNRAAQAGYQVDEGVRERMESRARGRIDAKTGKADTADAAGVDLYAVAASLGTMQDSENTNVDKKREAEQERDAAMTPAAKATAEGKLQRYEANATALSSARDSVVKRLDDETFIAGFGSNGGEEFLSYMNIGESLIVEGGEPWQRWDEKITANLQRVQNQDGSWTGHHCITGRSFCTAAALLVLMTDRAPMPLSSSLTRR